MASLRIGDSVSVPGNMYGILKFVGPVDGKKGTFAGVQLAPEFATRGKNSGDVEGKFYFRTTVPGSGIFLPAEKAEKRRSTPGTPGQALGEFNRGGRTPSLAAAGQKPNFSQSVGPGALGPGMGGIAARSGSPALKGTGPRRESLPRPSSPLRRAPMTSASQTPAAGRLATPKTRPSLGFNRSAIGAPGIPGPALKSPGLRQSSSVAANKFGQSLRSSTRANVTPGRLKAPSVARSEASLSTATTETSPLGPESAFDEEETLNGEGADSTPTPAAGRNSKKVSSPLEAETKRLREQLAERDRQLDEQANSIREIETELQQLMAAGIPESGTSENEEDLPKDVQTLRATLRDKNERIKALTAEFDANRADFRSTIDTLEMASTETERVYEKRVEELLEELRTYQEKHEDVDSMAKQFEQLEELVQELEEGLEDARRGEAEARGEVEFLRGEVERCRSELRREKERSRTGDRLNGVEPDGLGVSMDDLDELQLKLDQKDDEIRGLRAIIQTLNDSAASRSPDRDQTPKPNGGGWGHSHSKTKSTNTVVSFQENTAEHLQQQILDLESLLNSSSVSQEQLREEVSKIRQSVQFGASGVKVNIPGLGISQHKRVPSDIQKHRSIGASSSASTARPGSFKSAESGSSIKHAFHAGHRRKDTGIPESIDAAQSPSEEQFEDAYADRPGSPNRIEKTSVMETISVSDQTDLSSNAALWCEICEETGHDILTCSNMGFGSTNGNGNSTQQQPIMSTAVPPIATLRPTSGRDIVREGLRRSRDSPHPPPETNAPPPPGPIISNSEKDIDRPAPLSMNSRSNSTYTITSPTRSSAKRVSESNTGVKRNPSFSLAGSSSNAQSSHHTEERENRLSAISGGSSSAATNSNSNTTANTNHTSASSVSNVAASTPTPPLSSSVAANSNTDTKTKIIEGTGSQAGMLAGKESGIIDPDKWCAFCERDGHDSVDCPLEMGF